MELTEEASARVAFQITEDGEAVGTVRQFADQLHLPRPLVLSCLAASDAAPVVLGQYETKSNPVLIVDSEGIDALLDCTSELVG